MEMRTTMQAVSRRAAGAGLALALVTVATADAQPAAFASARAPSPAPPAAPAALAPVPFAVGEELTYKASFGGLPAGTARMRVDGVELVRGRPAYHLVFTLDGGVPFFRVRDRYESWIDVRTLASLRHRQQISEGRYKRTTTYEIYPDRAQYRKNDEAPQRSVGQPLDDGSFLYAVRVAGVRAGETRREDRYFRPDRNPVVLTGLRTETVTVGAGTFDATVVRPAIKANGIFSEGGEAQVWFSDDARRYPVQVKTRFARFSLSLSLESIDPGVDASALPGLIAAAPTP
jgi:hypothetical protein